MSDFLSTMAARSRTRVAEARRRRPEAELDRAALDGPEPPDARVFTTGFTLLAEIKRSAPSTGPLVTGPAPDLARRAQAYRAGGATIISVLTEPERFGGSLADLRLVAETGTPAMRKDFLVDPYQVAEARETGAAGVLLIVRMLSPDQAIELVDAAARYGLFVLVECFDHTDLDRAVRCVAHAETLGTAAMLGVNARDLTSLQVNGGRFAELAPDLPTGCPRVAESGLETADDIRRITGLGYHAALVGTALMQHPDPTAVVRSLVAAGREGVGTPCT